MADLKPQSTTDGIATHRADYLVRTWKPLLDLLRTLPRRSDLGQVSGERSGFRAPLLATLTLLWGSVVTLRGQGGLNNRSLPRGVT